MIEVRTPPDWDLKVDDTTDGVQISPLALLYLNEHIQNTFIKFDKYNPKDYHIPLDPRSTLPNFPSSKQVKILEFGGGCSTILFAKIFPNAQICVMEGEKLWYDRIMNWIEKDKLQNVRVILEEQISSYGFDSPHDDNMEYVNRAKEFGFPFDLILNDGAMREKVGDTVLENADTWLTMGGLYLRHDYERALDTRWIGPHIEPNPEWVTGKTGCFYENFCVLHPNYSMITVSGNQRAGTYCEYGGVWRRK